jgi:hypothetical protein
MILPESFRLIHNDLQIVKMCLYETDAGLLVAARNWDIAIHLTENFVSYVSHRIVIAL